MRNILYYEEYINEDKRNKWAKDICEIEASKYKSKRDFKKNSPGAYRSALYNGWIKDICNHMVPLIKNNYWTKERCQEEALKYNSRSEFETGSPTAYLKSGKMGWRDEICSHMKSNGNRYKRCIYAIEFSDNHVYVGLTHDVDKRFNQHLKDIRNNSVVYRHYLDTGILPTYKKISDYIDVDVACKLEGEVLQKYKSEGWNILNLAKCGNVGGKTIKWTKEKCKEESLKYNNRNAFKINSPLAYNACRRNGWLDEICDHMKNLKNYWDKDSCWKEASKYNKKDHFKLGNSGAYGAAYRNKWLDDFFPKNEKIQIDDGILNYEDCIKICKSNECFYESKHVIDGFNVSLFNYRIAGYNDFVNPIPGSNMSAKELRGICFVFNKDGSVYNRYLLLEKFFNLNQTPESMYSVVKDYKIVHVNNKEDGSIASFIRLPNGRVIGKSKMSFISEQSIAITKIYENNYRIREFVDWTLDNDIVAIFEYVSPENRIVLNYKNSDLILLRLRDNKTGRHLNLIDYLDIIGDIKIAPFEDEKSIDNLIERSKSETGREGWIITFENGLMIKIKTSEYLSLHGLFTQELNRENTIISLIIDEKMDDVLAQLGEDAAQKRTEIEKYTDIINHYISVASHEVDQLISEYSGDRKSFAINNHKNKFFPIAIGVIDGKDKMSLIKDRIKTDTKDLMKAKAWIEKNKI
jgi:T4 RnlA family RNA ligase